MFKKIVDLYNSRKASERILLMCTIYTGIIVGFISIRDDKTEAEEAINAKKVEIAKLETELSFEPKIMENLKEVKKNLDERKMVNAQALQLNIESFAKDAGITSVEIPAISESKLDKFQLFKLKVNIKVDMPNANNNYNTSSSNNSRSGGNRSSRQQQQVYTPPPILLLPDGTPDLRTPMERIIKFEDAIIKSTPYIRINAATIVPSKKYISASYEISSFILKD